MAYWIGRHLFIFERKEEITDITFNNIQKYHKRGAYRKKFLIKSTFLGVIANFLLPISVIGKEVREEKFKKKRT